MLDNDKKSTMAIIPARGGSKGILKKNIKDLAGKPLIAWTIEMSLKAPCIDRVIVSTDSEDIANVARAFGAEVPFLRPPELATDDTPDLPVYQHALAWIEESENYRPDIVVWLRPTCPLRRLEDVESAVHKLIETGSDCVRSVTHVKHHPYWMKYLEDDRLIPFLEGKDEKKYYQHQLLPDLYYLNGVVDVVLAKNVQTQQQLFCGDIRAIVTPSEFSIDIDSNSDFALADAVLERQKHD